MGTIGNTTAISNAVTPSGVIPLATAEPPVKVTAKRVVKRAVVAAKSTAKPTAPTAVKPTAAPKAKSVATTPTNSSSKLAPKTAVKAAVKAAIKAPSKSAATAALKGKAVKHAKAKKPKLVRDSFTIPKAEYTVLADLKQRAGKLGIGVKKNELIRAGVKALAALSDLAFQSALKAVPAIKTGRPSKAKN